MAFEKEKTEGEVKGVIGMSMKPSVIPSVHGIYKKLMGVGLTRDNIITLIQRETKLPRRDIEATIIALRKIENQIMRANQTSTTEGEK